MRRLLPLLAPLLILALLFPLAQPAWAQDPGADPFQDFFGEELEQCGADLAYLVTMTALYQGLAADVDVQPEQAQQFADWQTEMIRQTAMDCTGMTPEQLAFLTAPEECSTMAWLALLMPVWKLSEAATELGEDMMADAVTCSTWQGWDYLLSAEELEQIQPLREMAE